MNKILSNFLCSDLTNIISGYTGKSDTIYNFLYEKLLYDLKTSYYEMDSFVLFFDHVDKKDCSACCDNDCRAYKQDYFISNINCDCGEKHRKYVYEHIDIFMKLLNNENY